MKSGAIFIENTIQESQSYWTVAEYLFFKITQNESEGNMHNRKSLQAR